MLCLRSPPGTSRCRAENANGAKSTTAQRQSVSARRRLLFPNTTAI